MIVIQRLCWTVTALALLGAIGVSLVPTSVPAVSETMAVRATTEVPRMSHPLPRDITLRDVFAVPPAAGEADASISSPATDAESGAPPTLSGTLSDASGGAALLQSPDSRDTRLVHTGERVGRWLLLSVDDSSALLTDGRTPRRVFMSSRTPR